VACLLGKLGKIYAQQPHCCIKLIRTG
jgi:hypothetical protein